MKSKKKKFILTDDPKTANDLKTKGFTQVQENNGQYVFLNKGDKIYLRDKGKFVFIDKLMLSNSKQNEQH